MTSTMTQTQETARPTRGGERFWLRMGALAGLVFLVAYSIGTGLLAGPISQDDSLQTAAQTFNDKADSFDVGAALLIVSIPLLLAFVIALRRTLSPDRSEAGLAGVMVPLTAAAGALVLAGAAVMGGAAFLAEYARVSGSTAALAHSVAEQSVAYANVFFGGVALVTAFVSLRDRVLPRWFGWLAAVLAVAMMIGAVALPLIRPAALLANLSVGVFFLVASLLVMARAGKVL